MNQEHWRNQATQRLLLKYHITQQQAERWVDRYLSATREIFGEALLIATRDQYESGLLPINLERYNSRTRTRYKKQTIDLLAEFDLHKIISVGNNLKGKRTMATTELDYNDLALFGATPKETFLNIYSQYDGDDVEYDAAPIDIVSLTNYIDDCEKRLALSPAGSYQDSIQRQMVRAMLINEVAEATGGYLPQIVSESEYGRRYYTGLNLQNTKKILREAALGRHWSVDVSNSVYQWKYNLAKSIDPEFKMPHTLDYLDRKHKIRETVAQEVYGNTSERSISTIKECLTAIGFGAMLKESGYGTSVYRILGNEDRYHEFSNNQFIKNFYQEQEQANQLVFESVKKIWPQEKRAAVSDRRGLNRNKIIAMLYQTHERMLLDGLYAQMPELDIMLKIHDGFAVRTLTNQQRINIKMYFAQNQVSCDIQEHQAYQPNRWHIVEEETAHTRHIQQEELRARGYAASLNNSLTV